MYSILKVLTIFITVYTFLCFARIILSWLPKYQYTAFARFLYTICDPYLNFFRKLTFLRFGQLDFSVAAGICLLMALTTITGDIATQQSFTIGKTLAMLIALFWSIISSILVLIAVLLIIRLLVLLFSSNSYNPMWEQMDRTISHLVFKLSGLFFKNTVPYKKALIVSILTVIALNLAGKFLIQIICSILASIPF